MALQRADFNLAIQSFFSQIETVDAAWKHITPPTLLNQSYLEHTTRSAIPRTNPCIGTSSSSVQEDDDPAILAHDPSLETITLYHHVVYSPSYQVPVLYFNAYFSDGSTLGLDDLYTYVVPAVYQEDVKSSPIQVQGSITQTEHPILNTPFWYIHPCETQSMLRAILTPEASRHSQHQQQEESSLSTEKYIKVWLSLVGPLVKCHVPPELFM